MDSFQSSGPAGTNSQRFYDERLPFQFIYWESDGEITFNVVNENLLRMVNEAGNVQVEIQCRPSSDQFNKEVWLDGIAEVMVNQPGLKREEGRWEHETGGIDWIVDRYTYTLDGQTAYTEVYAGEIDGYVFAITASAYTEEALPVSGGKEKKVLSLKRNVNCPRRMAVYAVFDVLDRMGCQYEQALVGDIKAEAKVLGHTSEYAFAVTEQTINTSTMFPCSVRQAA